MNLIFVGGFYGVGKSTICAAAAAKLGSDVLHRAASALIKEMDPGSIPIDSKEVKNLDRNQQLLIARVNQLSASVSNLLLDGHYAIAVKGRGFEPIPAAVFSELRPAALVHVAGSADVVHGQLVARDGASAWTESQVAQMQAADLDQARAVAKQLGIELYETGIGDQQAFVGWLASKIGLVR